MSKEFTYRQRKTTDSYRKGWENAYSNENTFCTKCGKNIEVNKDFLNKDKYKYCKCEAETTEQKQPYSTI